MITFIIIGFLSFLLLELYLGFIYVPSRYKINYYRLRRKFLVYRYDSQTGYFMTPNIRYSNSTVPPPTAPRKREFVDIRTDQNGFLFTEDIDSIKKQNKLIFCIGGSTTAGMESSHDKTYPAHLDRLLKPLGYRSINAGLGGGRSLHELLVLTHKILPYQPSAVIVFSGYNDYESYAYGVSAPYNPFRHYLSHMLSPNKMMDLIEYSFLIHKIKSKWMKWAFNKKKDAGSKLSFQKALVEPVWVEEWKTNIGAMMDLCRKRGVQFFLLSTMNPVYAGASEEAKLYANRDIAMEDRFDLWIKYLELIHSISMELCDKKKSNFIDVRPYFDDFLSQFRNEDYYKKRFSLFTDRIHFSEEGNALLAKAIYERLKDRLS